MFDEKPEVTEAADAVYALTAELLRGDMLTHEAISEVLGLAPHEGVWDHVVRKVGRRLERERGIAFWPNTRAGYKLCTTAEQLELPVERARRGLRQLRRGRKSVEAIPEQLLTAHQRRVRAFMAERSRDAERSLRRDMRAQQQQVRPSQTIPRRPALAESGS